MYGNLMEGISISDDTLDGFKIDVFQWLIDCKYFTNVEVDITTDIDCLINASLNYQGDVSEVWVAEELCRIWEKHLRYGFFETHSYSIEEGVITFNFFTRSQQHSFTGEQHGTTGKITAYP